MPAHQTVDPNQGWLLAVRKLPVGNAKIDDSGPQSCRQREAERPCVSRVCARWFFFSQTFWNHSPVRNEDNMKVTASN
jgi:hypothetical protein